MRRVAVIGAGAAGAIAAIFAARGGAQTLLLERTADGGRKILISGGGRCNILPASLDESRFVTQSSPNTLRKILRSWPLAEQIAFFERDVGLPLVEERETGKLFPATQRARDVRDRLLALASASGAKLVMSSRVVGLVPPQSRSAPWRIESEHCDALEADAVIVATGGLSVPKTGSDGGGLAIVERLGHAVYETYPALTPVLAAPSPFESLAGVSLRASVTASDGVRTASATGGFLFRHDGYSGPAVLDVSHVVARSVPPRGEIEGSAPRAGAGAAGARARLIVRWVEGDDAAWHDRLRAADARTVGGALLGALPERLWRALIAHAGIDAATQLAALRRPDRFRLVDALLRFELPWSGHAGYKSAEVTGGGVSLAEIDARSMESRRHPGLFLCGEILDAFGPIGGYNFYWAWVTGRAAGIAASSPPTSR